MPLQAADLPCPPRFGTPRRPDRATLGPMAAAVAETLGKPYMPHQRYMADVALEIDNESGLLAYDEVIIIGPRQVSGKSEFLLPFMAHRCVGFDKALTDWVSAELGIRNPPPGPQRVVYTAQTGDEARSKWRDLHVPRIKASQVLSEQVLDIRLRLNAEQITWVNGSTWAPKSTTKKTGATGDTVDLGVLDEAWSRPDNSTELAMRPTGLTRDWRQLLPASMVPGPSRAPDPAKWSYLRLKRAVGRSLVESGVTRGKCFFEFSADPASDPADPATWWSCMPGLGITARERNVRSDFETMRAEGNLADFKAEYLGIEPLGNEPKWLVVREATWRNLWTPNAAYRHPIALGVDADPDQAATSIGQAALTDDGDTFVELIDRRAGLAWAVDALVTLCRLHRPCALGVDRNGPAAAIIEPLRRVLADEGLDVELCPFDTKQVAAACSQLFHETGEKDPDEPVELETRRRLCHLGQHELDTAVGGAIKHWVGDQWRWARGDAATDCSPLYAVTLARAAGEVAEWVGAAYDIAASLG